MSDDDRQMSLRCEELQREIEALRRERDDLRAAVEAFGMDPAKIVAWANKAARGEEAAGEVLERADKAREGLKRT